MTSVDSHYLKVITSRFVLSHTYRLSGSVAFEVISMSSSVEINLLVNPSIPGSLKYFDTKMLFDLVIVNLGVRNPNLETILAL